MKSTSTVKTKETKTEMPTAVVFDAVIDKRRVSPGYLRSERNAALYWAQPLAKLSYDDCLKNMKGLQREVISQEAKFIIEDAIDMLVYVRALAGDALFACGNADSHAKSGKPIQPALEQIVRTIHPNHWGLNQPLIEVGSFRPGWKPVTDGRTQ